MGEHHVQGHVAVGIAVRMRVTRAGCRQRLETQALQIAGCPDVPRVWDDETASLVQCAERAAFFGDTHGSDPRDSVEATMPPTLMQLQSTLHLLLCFPGLRRAPGAINTRAASIFRHRVVIGMTWHLLFAAAAIRYSIGGTQYDRGPPCRRFR